MKKKAFWEQDDLETRINDITRRIRVPEEEGNPLKVFTNKRSEIILKNRKREKAVEDGLLSWLKGAEVKREELKKSLQPSFTPALCKNSLRIASQRKMAASGMQMYLSLIPDLRARTATPGEPQIQPKSQDATAMIPSFWIKTR